jgi:hypothetical protein
MMGKALLHLHKVNARPALHLLCFKAFKVHTKVESDKGLTCVISSLFCPSSFVRLTVLQRVARQLMTMYGMCWERGFGLSLLLLHLVYTYLFLF